MLLLCIIIPYSGLLAALAGLTAVKFFLNNECSKGKKSKGGRHGFFLRRSDTSTDSGVAVLFGIVSFQLHGKTTSSILPNMREGNSNEDVCELICLKNQFTVINCNLTDL